jgi:hypothetical protein
LPSEYAGIGIQHVVVWWRFFLFLPLLAYMGGGWKSLTVSSYILSFQHISLAQNREEITLGFRFHVPRSNVIRVGPSRRPSQSCCSRTRRKALQAEELGSVLLIKTAKLEKGGMADQEQPQPDTFLLRPLEAADYHKGAVLSSCPFAHTTASWQKTSFGGAPASKGYGVWWSGVWGLLFRLLAAAPATHHSWWDFGRGFRRSRCTPILLLLSHWVLLLVVSKGLGFSSSLLLWRFFLTACWTMNAYMHRQRKFRGGGYHQSLFF